MAWQNGLIRDMVKPEYLIVSSELGVAIADKFPKAMHHYLVLPTADIPSIFVLNRSHLPLLEELYRLARNAVEKKGVPWEDFQVGFHAEPSLHRLHLHVISTDFVSPSLKTKKHWNCHNTELFVPYEKLYEQLERDNCFSRFPKSLVKELLAKPLVCNQCEFASDSLLNFKTHLLNHWQRKEDERKKTTNLDNITKMMNEAKLDTKIMPLCHNQGSKNPFQLPSKQQAVKECANHKLDLSTTEMIQRNNPPFNFQAMNPLKPNNAPKYRQHHGSRTIWNGPSFPPFQHQINYRYPMVNGFRGPSNIIQHGIPHYPNQAFVGPGAWPSGQQSGVRSKLIPRNYQQNQNQQRSQQNSNLQHPTQNVNRNQVNPSNCQNPNQNRQNYNQKATKPINQPAGNLHDQEVTAPPP
ncbi:aprataxin-like protein [Drosophila elegans]|uniref:aprataxin-like protein n=1 Tax=Drosophila elegans TaxID=30023 RepID=UPI0007E689E2|nr:aprataxin-like protein [Drosophila elegans]